MAFWNIVFPVLSYQMEAVAAKLGARNEGPDEKGGIAAELKAFGHRVDEISTTVNKVRFFNEVGIFFLLYFVLDLYF